jgi:hypothetical protein
MSMRSRRISVMFLFLVLICIWLVQVVLAEESIGYDTWLIREFESQPIGLLRLTLSKVIQENKVTYMQTEVLEQPMVLLDGSILEQQWVFELIYDENWELMSFHFTLPQIDSERYVHGVFQDDSLHLSVTEDDDAREMVIALPVDYVDLFSTSALMYRLNGDIVVGETYYGYSFDYDLMDFRNVSVTIIDRIVYDDGTGTETEVYEVEMEVDDIVVEEYIGLNGEIHAIEYIDPPSGVARRIDEKNLPDMIAVDGRQMLLRVNENIPRYSRVDYLKLRLNFGDSVPEGIQLEDNRTKIVEERVLRSSSSITVEITSENRNFAGVCEFPVSDEALVKYAALGKRTSDKENELIRELAGKIVGDETDVWLACVRLAQWLEEHIESVSYRRELSVSEVLSIEKADHIARLKLFTALARTLGIPTKIIGGYQYVGTCFSLYYWSEIWIGTCVTSARVILHR